MKKKVFNLLLVFVVILISYLIIGIWGLIEIKTNDVLLFKNKIDLKFHQKYSDKVHHLRDVNKWGDKKNEYLFSQVNFDKNFSRVINYEKIFLNERIRDLKYDSKNKLILLALEENGELGILSLK